MTRRHSTLPAPVEGDKTTLLKPLAPLRNRTDEVVDRIAREIRGGALAPGARLPTEHALMAAMGVSRTVVREAVAALKAEGLVTTRQGSGAFVAKDASRIPFRIDSAELSAIDAAIGVMELRLAVEVEAAALAAERADAQAIAAVDRAREAFVAAVERGESAVTEDFDFHLAVARASGNARFADFLAFLGNHVIPRQSVRIALTGPDERQSYLLRIDREHQRVAAAIRAQQSSTARRAMREHLKSSLERYRGLAARAGAES